MNTLELKMVSHLKDMNKKFNVHEVKMEFEAEGTRLYEAMCLKKIASAAELGLVFKIGGPEAVTDMFYAQNLGVSGVIAPMVESGYAMRKYLEAIQKYFPEDLRKTVHFGVNIETHQAYKQLDDILSQKLIHLIDTVTLGRVDMAGSLNIARSDLNSEKILEIALDMFARVKKKGGFRTTMGGGIAKESLPFIKKLVDKKLLDRVETRKIVFDLSKGTNHLEEGIIAANNFEFMWLENKRNYYKTIASEDDLRIVMLLSRIP